MNFDPDARQEQLRQDIQDLTTGEAESLRKVDPADPKDLYWAYRGLLKKLSRSGYLEIGFTAGRAGGAPFLDYSTAVLAGEALAGALPDFYLGIEISSRLVGGLLSHYGSDDQKRRYLDLLGKGELLGTAALRESLGNFSGRPMNTRADKQGGQYFLNGIKKGVINGSLADIVVVSALIGDQLGFFLVPSGGDGLTVSKNYRMLGYERIALTDLVLVDAPVPEGDLLGPFDPFLMMMELGAKENMALTVSSLGLIRRTLFSAKSYAAEKREGDKPLLAQQEIRYRLAEMFALFQTAQLLTYRAAWMLEVGAAEAATVADTAKVFVTEAAEEVARGAMQITALDGYLEANDFEAGYRDARFGPSAGETSEVLRMRIAEDCLKKYA